MTDYHAIARQALLEPTGLTDNDLSNVIGKLHSIHGCDYADLYFQYQKTESWTLDEGKVKSGNFSIEQGVGLRSVVGDKTAFAYSEDLSIDAITAATKVAQAIGGQQQDYQQSIAWKQEKTSPLYLPTDPLVSMDDQEKTRLLGLADQYARAADSRVQEVTASLSGVYEVVMVVNTLGQQVPDVRPLVRLNVSVIVEQDGRRERGSMGGGGRQGYEIFTDAKIKEYAEESVRQALVNLEAVDSPAGTMTVVLGSGWPGILLHEAVGHGLEGDFNRKGTSVFSGKIGQKVASEHCTIIDDGTIENRRGSLSVDDEGNQTKRNVLIEKGILKGYMHDTMNARLMGHELTGNGRRESFAHLPMPRMTNTYMLGGGYAPEEVIGSVDKGIYAVNFGGGQVDITSGQFVFSSSEAYLIENGKVTRPVKGATLIGNGPEAMQRVSMVADDMALDSGVGVCGKDGQSVPVGVGQPTMRIDGLTVGGVQL
ncbi:MAG: metalloprotease TldD [Arenicella sp.]